MVHALKLKLNNYYTKMMLEIYGYPNKVSVSRPALQYIRPQFGETMFFISAYIYFYYRILLAITISYLIYKPLFNRKIAL